MPVSNYPGHGLFLPYLINRTATVLNRQMLDFLDQRGLTLTHWRVLAFLAKQDDLSIGELAQSTMTEQSTLSRSLRVLEQQGFVRRTNGNSGDSRAVHVHLEALGHQAFEEILAHALELEATYTAGITDEEKDVLRRVLQRVIVNCGARP